MTATEPLRGRTVLVTRGAAKGDELGALLEAAGARVIRVPMIAIERLPAAGRLIAAVDRLRSHGPPAWLVLTSETAVAILFEQSDRRPELDGVAAAVVGPATAAALRGHGVEAQVVAPGQVAESLAEELVARDVSGAEVVVVAAAGGRDVVGPALRAAGARVEVIAAYRAVIPEGAVAALRDALAASPPDAVTFTSGSAVTHVAEALAGSRPPRCPAVCIGPVTAAVARRAGWVPVVVAEEHTAPGLAAAVVSLLAAHRLP